MGMGMARGGMENGGWEWGNMARVSPDVARWRDLGIRPINYSSRPQTRANGQIREYAIPLIYPRTKNPTGRNQWGSVYLD